MTAHRFNATRRSILQGGSALALLPASALCTPATAQATRDVKFTLPWLANGSTSFPYIAKHQGFFKKHGLNVTIARGFGSLAAAQAVGGGEFDFGMSFAGAVILGVARGLPLISLGSFSYDSTMGALMRADSPIKEPKDFEGKKVGIVPTGADAPYWPAFLKKEKIDPKTITMVQCDARVLEQTLVSKQVDAVSAIASSSLPLVMSMNEKSRFMLWSKFGLRQYAGQLITRPGTLEHDPALCEAMSMALMEGLAFALRDPEASIDIFFKEVPEAALMKNAKENARLSQGLMHYTVLSPEAETHGLGYNDQHAVEDMIGMVVDYGGAAGLVRPRAEAIFTNRFAGQTKLTSEEWARVRDDTKEFAALLV